MTYAGTIQQRLSGLKQLLEIAQGKSVLDIGCAEGLIAYEFVKAGASYICAVEKDIKDAALAKKILARAQAFCDIICTDVIENYEIISDKFDIVLYLGVQHHFEKQAGREKLIELIFYLSDLCTGYFAVRTTSWDLIETALKQKNFSLLHAHPGTGTIGALKIYQKT